MTEDEKVSAIVKEQQFAFSFLGLHDPAKTAEVSRKYAAKLHKKISKALNRKIDLTVVSRIVDGEVSISTSLG